MDREPALDLCRFINAAPCAAHAADELCRQLDAAGYAALDLGAPRWELAPGRYRVRRGASVVAWVVRAHKPHRYLLIGAHTDSPHLQLKPRAPFANEGCLQLGVEVYGGALLNSWLDRDLGLAGTVATADGQERSVRIHRPLARVPQLAIHLDRRINDDGLKLNQQQHLAPIWGLAADGDQKDAAQKDPAKAFLDLLAAAAGVAPRDLVAHTLALYDLAPAILGGADDAFIFAGRLDNLASCHAALCALLAADAGGDARALPLIACLDHEEVGSTSDGGADGVFLATVLERLALGLGLDRGAHLAALAGGLMLSADMAHACHPNYADRHEPRHKPILGQGPVLKRNASQRYATTAATAGAVARLARAAGVGLQDFVTRSDLGCGSTIGPLAAARLGIAVADLGCPMLSMHSARECAATADHAGYVRLLAAHLLGTATA
jgi:aspartyl aminopeptidase